MTTSFLFAGLSQPRLRSLSSGGALFSTGQLIETKDSYNVLNNFIHRRSKPVTSSVTS
jgi:hypothetical protein